MLAISKEVHLSGNRKILNVSENKKKAEKLCKSFSAK